MKYTLILFVGFTFLFSCDTEESLTCEEILKISKNEVQLKSGVNEAIITIESNKWKINQFTFEGIEYEIDNNNTIDYYTENYIIPIKDGTIIEKKSQNTIYIKFNENKSQEKRVMTIEFISEGCTEKVTISQSAILLSDDSDG